MKAPLILRTVPALLVTIALLVLGGCCMWPKRAEQRTYHPGGPYYYSDWASYIKPFQPLNEISQEEAINREKEGLAYYEAHFDAEGRIVLFKKHFQGKILFSEQYFYKGERLIKSMTTHEDGRETTKTYEEE